MWPPFFVSLNPPTSEEQKEICDKGMRLGFNYSCPGVSQQPAATLPASVRMGAWWRQDRQRVKVGYGRRAYQETKQLVSRWGHFDLPWASVDPTTGTKPGSPVCVTAKVFGLWTGVPLKVVYKKEGRWQEEAAVPAAGGAGKGQQQPAAASGRRRGGQRFMFGCGTLGSHYLRGEERFTVEWDRTDDSVWYEVYSFSAPDHPLAFAGYPVVRWLQAQFRQQSAREVARAAAAASLDRSARRYTHIPTEV